MMLFPSSAFRTTFGMARCDVFSAAFKAVAVIPGIDAIVAKLGAFTFGERRSFDWIA